MTNQGKQIKIKTGNMTKKKLQEFNARIALLQSCLKQARDYLEKNLPLDTSSTSPSYQIDGAVRDIDSIQEELRVLTFIQPYL